jgi:hypothetical protein
MPLTDKGDKIMGSMKSEYGPEKGKSVFYASKNAGKISGVDDTTSLMDRLKGRFDEITDEVNKISERCDALCADDDRSAEEHALAAKFHKEEAERGDDDCK